MIVINLFGGPGCGKSTTAAHLFVLLKKLGYNTELVTEFAKDLTYEERNTTLTLQPYVFAKQLKKLLILKDKVDIVITDSPLLLSVVYNPNLDDCNFEKYVINTFSSFENINIFLQSENPYQRQGRSQTKKEADIISEKIKDLLIECSFNFRAFQVTSDFVETNLLPYIEKQIEWVNKFESLG